MKSLYFFASLLILQSCGGSGTSSDPATAPTIKTVSYSSVTSSTVIITANVTSDGGATTTRGICWSTNQNPTISDSKVTSATGIGSFNATLTGLTANTLYYARAFATNSAGTSYGDPITFTTLPPTAPVVSTTALSSITASSATTGGTISSDGGSTVTARGICWSTTANPTVDLSTKTSDGTGSGSFTSNISGLTVNVSYHVRAYATNLVGTSYGEDRTFTATPSSSGTLAGTISASTYNGKYAPSHVLAAWVTTNTGVFVKSLMVYAAARKGYLTNWSISSSNNTTDATTGATINSYSAQSLSWNGKDTGGNVVADGTYRLNIEFTESDATGKYAVYSFTKASTASSGGTAVTSSTYITLNSLTWTPN